MTDAAEDAEVERIECPQKDCGLRMNANELVVHLQWNHNLSETQAEAMIDYER